jgi:imidazoleglycerol-phosphate dehydratase
MRKAAVERRTQETNIKLELVLDGLGNATIASGVGFFDHLLTAMAKHGFFDLSLQAEGDYDVDYHHTIEDCGICLGQAFARAYAPAVGLKRFGNAFVPMDEALAQVTVDVSGRPYLVYNAGFAAEHIGQFPTELIEDFLQAFASNARLTLHVNLVYGRNSHHAAEAIFKALGRALDEALTLDPRIEGALSTKGTL